MNVRVASLLPARLWMGLFFLAPLMIIGGFSLLNPGGYRGG